MRSLAPLLAFVTLLSLAPAPVAAATLGCTIEATPATGTGAGTFRFTGRHFPSTADGSSLEVELDIARVTRTHPDADPITVMFLALIPGGHHFYVDYNQVSNGQPPLKPGRYRVLALTPHQPGCRTRDWFWVVRR